MEVVFPLGSCNVRESLRMEDNAHSKGASDEALLALATFETRNQCCAICYYDSDAEAAESDQEELEKEISRALVGNVGRYAQLAVLEAEENDEYRTLPVCQHRFHTVCLYKWLKAERGGFTCPICRGGLHKQRLQGIPELFEQKPQYVVKLWNSGKVQEEYFELNGVREGLYKSYYENGTIERVCNYQANEMHGTEQHYHKETGKLTSEVDFQHGKKHGWSRWYTSSGIIIGETQYKEGIRSGAKKEWFTDRPGRLMNVEHYLDGKRHGLFMRWSFKGELLLYGVYRNDEKDGRFIRWFDETHTIKIKEYYVNGVRHGLSAEYYPPERNSRSQRPIPKEIGHYQHGLRIGCWMNYWSNGQIKTKSEYNSLGNMDGLHQEWNRFGKCVKRFRYDDGVCDGVCESFDENTGCSLELANYRKGQLHGLYVQYHKGTNHNRPKVIRVFDQSKEMLLQRFSRTGQRLQMVDNRPRQAGKAQTAPSQNDVIHVVRHHGRQVPTKKPRFIEETK